MKEPNQRPQICNPCAPRLPPKAFARAPADFDFEGRPETWRSSWIQGSWGRGGARLRPKHVKQLVVLIHALERLQSCQAFQTSRKKKRGERKQNKHGAFLHALPIPPCKGPTRCLGSAYPSRSERVTRTIMNHPWILTNKNVCLLPTPLPLAPVKCSAATSFSNSPVSALGARVSNPDGFLANWDVPARWDHASILSSARVGT